MGNRERRAPSLSGKAILSDTGTGTGDGGPPGRVNLRIYDFGPGPLSAAFHHVDPS